MPRAVSGRIMTAYVMLVTRIVAVAISIYLNGRGRAISKEKLAGGKLGMLLVRSGHLVDDEVLHRELVHER
jgi:hypothetical protein